MDYALLTGLTVSVAALVVGLFLLLSYLSSLVKSAYHIKVDIRADMEKNLKQISQELAKRSRLVRSELSKDARRIRSSLEQDNAVRVDRMENDLKALVEEATRKNNAMVQERLDAIALRLASLEETGPKNGNTTLKKQATRKPRRETPLQETIAEPSRNSRDADTLAAQLRAVMQDRQEKTESTDSANAPPPLPKPVNLPDFGSPSKHHRT